jgi:hypothetical protein
MKAPKFNRSEALWDRWKEFYVENACFTFFESGEVIATDSFRTRSGWGYSNGRAGRGYKQWGVTVFQMNDNNGFPYEGKALCDPADGTIVKKSWLPQASPMLYDHDAKRVIGLQWIHQSDKAAKLIPSRFAGRCSAYWPGDGRDPVGGGLVYYSKLIQWSKEQKAEARARVMLIKTQYRILGIVPGERNYMGGFRKATIEQVLKTPVNEMDERIKQQIACQGVETGYTSCSAEYLEVIDV